MYAARNDSLYFLGNPIFSVQLIQNLDLKCHFTVMPLDILDQPGSQRQKLNCHPTVNLLPGLKGFPDRELIHPKVTMIPRMTVGQLPQYLRRLRLLTIRIVHRLKPHPIMATLQCWISNGFDLAMETRLLLVKECFRSKGVKTTKTP